MNDQETDLVLGQVCVTLANLLLFGSSAAQTVCFTNLVEMSRAEELSRYQRAALRSVADVISAYHAKVREIEQAEKSEDPVPPDALRVGSICRFSPVLGKRGEVAAYRVIDDSDGKEIMVVPASSVKVGRS
jgi:hypothetical protein